MSKYQDFLNLDCKVFNLKNITEKLFNTREKFCIGKCRECSIYFNYWHLGLSCNDALNKYPNECMKIMEDNGMFQKEETSGGYT